MVRFYGKMIALLSVVAGIQSGAALILAGGDAPFPYIGPPNSVETREVRPGIDRLQPLASTTLTRNSYGLRGRDSSERDEYSVVTLGNSTTLCIALDDTQAWPQRLENELNARYGERFWVLNAGIRGATTRHYAYVCEYVLPALDGVQLALIAPSPYELNVYLADPRQFGNVNWRSERAAVEEVERRILWERRAQPERGPLASAAADLLERWTERYSPEAATPGAGNSGLRNEFVADFMNARRATRQSALKIDEAPPDLAVFGAEVRANLEAAVLACRSAGVEPVLVTSPALWQESMTPETDALLGFGKRGNWRSDHEGWYPVSVLVEGLAVFNDAIRSTAEDLDVALIELDSMIESSAENFSDDVHFTPLGAERVGAALAEPVYSLLQTI